MTTTTKRGWFRFSLQTMFVVVTVICVIIPWGIKNWRQLREREALFRAFCARGAALGPVFAPGEPIIGKVTGKPIPWSWRLFGAEDPGGDIWLPPDKFTADERDHLQALFPEAFMVWWDDKNQRLLETEDPIGTFPALWKCPQCGYLWQREFRGRAEAVASAKREMEAHDADRHPAPLPNPATR